MLAYSPTLPLQESLIAIYSIYVLKHPDTQEVFYVGQTINEIECRLQGHLAESTSNLEKVQYLKELLEQGKKPIIETIEAIPGTCYIDKMAVNEREIYWIRYYKAIGCKLLNKSATSNGAKCHEYHSYLASIKRGQSSYHYYYCGKTITGTSVYDAKRLNADGFKLPDPVINYYVAPAVPIEDTYTYQRMLKKLGASDLSGNSLYYDKTAYRDCNPDYYDDDY